MTHWDWNDSEVVDVGTPGIDRGPEDADRPNPHDIDWMEDGEQDGSCPVCGGHVVHETVEVDDWCGHVGTYTSTYCEGVRDDGAGCGWIA